MKRILGGLAAITIGLSTLGIATTPADAGGFSPRGNGYTITEVKDVGKVVSKWTGITILGRQRTVKYKSTALGYENTQTVNKTGYDSCSAGSRFYAVKIKLDSGQKLTYHNCTGAA